MHVSKYPGQQPIVGLFYDWLFCIKRQTKMISIDLFFRVKGRPSQADFLMMRTIERSEMLPVKNITIAGIDYLIEDSGFDLDTGRVWVHLSNQGYGASVTAGRQAYHELANRNFKFFPTAEVSALPGWIKANQP